MSPTPDPSGRHPHHRWLALAVAAAALAVRVAYFATVKGVAFHDPLVDGDYNDWLGQHLAEGGRFPPGPLWQPPLYPLMLAVLYSAFGHTLWAPRIFMALLASLGAATVFDLAERATSSRWLALGAGLGAALYGPLVFYDAELLPTSLGTFLIVLALWMAIARPPSARQAVAAGVVSGLAGLAVAPALLAAPAVAWAAGRKRRLWAALSALATAAVVMLAVFHNYQRSGAWMLVSANAGINLWIGNNPQGDELEAVRPGSGWEHLVNEPVRLGITNPAAQDRYFASKALSYCTSSPKSCLGGFARKVRRLLASRELPRNEDLYALRYQSPVLKALIWKVGGVGFPAVVLIPLAGAGLAVILLKRRDCPTAALACAQAVALLALGPLLFFVTARYRVVLVPFALVVAAVGAKALRQSLPLIRSRRWAQSIPALATVVCLVAAVVPVRAATDRVNFFSEMNFAVGGRRARLGNWKGAVASYVLALMRAPDYLEAAFNLGVAWEHLDDPQNAANAFGQVLKYYPKHAEARWRRAHALVAAGSLDEAEQDFLQLLADHPGDVPPQLALARLHLMRGNRAQALEWIIKAEQAGAHPGEIQALRERL